MNLFPNLRAIVFLRRISRALENQNKLLAEQNELTRIKLSIEHPAAYKSAMVRGERTGKMVEFSVASVADWDRQWRENHGLSDLDADSSMLDSDE